MLMYYDARINSSMNGLFKFVTLDPLKGYYPIKIWGEMLQADGECETHCDVPDIYAVSAVKHLSYHYHRVWLHRQAE